MAALTVVPAASAGLTLYAIEEHLQSFADTAELVSAEQEQQFLAELHVALTTAADKRDRVGQFMAHVEHQAAFAAAEIKRIQERKRFYEQVAERMEQYIIGVIVSLGTDAKGKPRKLEGNVVTFALRNCPPSVQIEDENAVPADYKSVTVTVPLSLWNELLNSLDVDFAARILDAAKKPTLTVSKSGIKAALDAGNAIPGALLVTDKKSLIRK